MCADRQSVFKCVICKSILIDVTRTFGNCTGKKRVSHATNFFFLFFFAEVGISEITVVVNAALYGDVIVIDVHKSGKMFKGPLNFL